MNTNIEHINQGRSGGTTLDRQPKASLSHGKVARALCIAALFFNAMDSLVVSTSKLKPLLHSVMWPMVNNDDGQ